MPLTVFTYMPGTIISTVMKITMPEPRPNQSMASTTTTTGGMAISSQRKGSTSPRRRALCPASTPSAKPMDAPASTPTPMRIRLTPALAKNSGLRTNGPMARSASQGVAINSGPSWRAATCQANRISSTPAALQAREVRVGAARTGPRPWSDPLMTRRTRRAAGCRRWPADSGRPTGDTRPPVPDALAARCGSPAGCRGSRSRWRAGADAAGARAPAPRTRRMLDAPARGRGVRLVHGAAERGVVRHAGGSHDAGLRQRGLRGKGAAPGLLQALAAMKRGRARGLPGAPQQQRRHGLDQQRLRGLAIEHQRDGVLAVAGAAQRHRPQAARGLRFQQGIQQHRRQVALERHHQFAAGRVLEGAHGRIAADQPQDAPHRNVQQAHRHAAGCAAGRQRARRGAEVQFPADQQRAQLVGGLPQAEAQAVRVLRQGAGGHHVHQGIADHGAGAGQRQHVMAARRRRAGGRQAGQQGRHQGGGAIAAAGGRIFHNFK